MSRDSDQPLFRLPPIVSLTLGLAAAAVFGYIAIRDLSDGDVRLFRLVFDRDDLPVFYWTGISVEFLVPAIFVIAVLRRFQNKRCDVSVAPKPAPIDPSYVLRLRSALATLQERSSQLVNHHGWLPLAGSTAESEQQSCSRPESITTVCTIGSTLIEYGSEHLSVFEKIITEPIEPLAAFTCIRSMLEACSVVVWTADPAIKADERIARVFAYRYEGVQQQQKCARSFGASTAEMQKIEDRLKQIEKDGLAAGVSTVTKMPNATDLIKLALGQEQTYRLLSAVAHGHNWALGQVGFKIVGPGPVTIGKSSVHQMEKIVDVTKLAYIGLQGCKAFCMAYWNYGRYVGWDESSMSAIFEATFDELHANASQRFWR